MLTCSFASGKALFSVVAAVEAVLGVGDAMQIVSYLNELRHRKKWRETQRLRELADLGDSVDFV